MNSAYLAEKIKSTVDFYKNLAGKLTSHNYLTQKICNPNLFSIKFPLGKLTPKAMYFNTSEKNNLQLQPNPLL